MQRTSNWATLIGVWVSLAACRSNPFGNTPKPSEDFHIYLSDFTTQTDGGMKAALLEVVNSSKQTLNCAFSALTLPEVVNALIARAKAGVQVRIAFDADGDPGSAALEATGAFLIAMSPLNSTQSQLLYGNRGGGVMRHNFCLADERVLYISTAAPDDAQMRTMPQVALKINGAAFGLPREFLREMNLFSQLVFGQGKAKTDFSTKYGILDQTIAVYWGPQEDPMDVLGTALAEAAHSVDFYATGYQTTNPGKATLDVPQAIARLELSKGIPVQKIFSATALRDASDRGIALMRPLLFANAGTVTGANIFLVDRGLPAARAFIYTGTLRTQANTSDDSLLVELRGKYATQMVGAYLDKIAIASSYIDNIGDRSYPGAVVINEILWMGTYSNALASDGSDEFIELYNNTDSPVNLSGWKFACTGDGGTMVNSGFPFPAATVIGPGKFLVIAAKSTGAFLRADQYTGDLSVTNNSQECRLMNAQNTVIDAAGDGVTGFDSVPSMGISDTTSKIRRSMERVNPLAPGNNTTNWQANANTPVNNNLIEPGFSAQTFASPGAKNSTALAIALLNPSFESALAWSSQTAGSLIYDAIVPPYDGSRVVHYNSLTSSLGGREFHSECLPASTLTHYSASVYEFAPATNVSYVNASIKLWWYSDTGCNISAGQSTQAQSTVSPQGTWNRRTYSQTSPAGTQSMRISMRARYATAAECGACTNTNDMVYFDCAAITTP